MRRNVGDEQFVRPLVPIDKLRFAGSFEICNDLIMLLSGTAFLDCIALPGDVRLPARPRVAPPPDLVALIVAAEDDIGPAIAVHIIYGPARFHGEILVFDDIAIPATFRTAIPYERGRGLTKTQDKAID